MNGNSFASNVLFLFCTVTDPTATCAAHTVNLMTGANPSGTMVAADIDGGSSDNCPISLNADQTSFDCDDVGSFAVTLTATDGAGNTDTCDATVTVLDGMQ